MPFKWTRNDSKYKGLDKENKFISSSNGRLMFGVHSCVNY